MTNQELHFPLLATEEKFDTLVTEIATSKVYKKLGYNIHIPNPNGDGIIMNEKATKMFKWEREEAVITLADLFDIPLQYFLDNGMVSNNHWD